MIELLGDHAIAVPDVGGYRVEVLSVVERLLAEDRLRPAFLFARVPTHFVTESELIDVDPGLRTLRSLNTPQDHEAALAEVGGRQV